MAPVELKVNVHCSSCVKKIKLAIKDVRGMYTSL
jgi:copper chaperone CopZ